MNSKWYVVPAGYALRQVGTQHEEADIDVPTMHYVHPAAGSIWPAARSLPRRMRGKLKR